MKQSVTACWVSPAFQNTLNNAFLYNDFVSHKAKLNGSNGGGEQALQGWAQSRTGSPRELLSVSTVVSPSLLSQRNLLSAFPGRLESAVMLKVKEES